MRLCVLLVLVGVAHADVTISEKKPLSIRGMAVGCGQVLAWEQYRVWWAENGQDFVEVFTGDAEVHAGAISAKCEPMVALGDHIVVHEGWTRWGRVQRRAEKLYPLSDGRVIADDGATLALLNFAGGFLRELPTPERGNAGNELSVDRDGNLYWMHGYEAACGGGGQARERSHLDGRPWTPMKWERDAAWAMGARGWVYFTRHDERGDILVGVDAAGVEHDIQPASDFPFPAFHDERRTLTLVSGKLVSLEGARARVLAASTPAEVHEIASDARGAVWLRTSGGIFRLHADRWVRLRVSPEDSALPPSP
jgi:hypothetical protein